ncbi:imidazolonepropionase [Deinococcus radiodurans]|jgi:imidazolonepropionase (EC 3.5.2.7)|uniref:Imidazolonepropionase n=1 Tax=Deinococcus radiodurans (strain ATCC 13939 / DSM 20539 / JCM 16871 / CCUG 27074 / LMG 4051 / NBRC 15346 / NCIMB 9279 / VKM B-1422 / R1) TaxID=243230 RepID=HUTI_DEIRA|nr:imidazolonepropionase [Deinococcus radiodurans]Q9RZ05.1 RecName: Full=Imidazolonepropionase; AltName: Full=Imidazolone-5-propionate hydrolase [Deinococcus radiodurans R1 = ATCC 13939 = DSM 20539]AAF12215.1 imidazolonepropionase [Deinococcus radiodurans R1 = ATCC 13939 = DSM 20539]ANC73004.1 imidazolonepropionase [Deinococcus radiodurans R1 = ATCC 13939 = DSM 20539]QEM72958.1 imidazolonepropionase [Deinococcus radiodurans]QIP30357.1 imidazolonepropionase [Deinococcus radiodurans]QIP33284.1 
MSETLYTGISQLATPRPGPQRGAAMGDLHIIEDAALLVRGGVIQWVGPRAAAPTATHVHDLGGRAVVPGLVDPHTHAVWAGDRLSDWEAKLQGATYEEILARGGGIRSTMRATAAADVAELVALARPRLASLRASGATTTEVKSGYGLDFDAELRMLRAVRELQAEFELRPTLLIHVPPQEGRAEYVVGVCAELIPQVAREGLAEALDVFCEKEAFSVEETRTMFAAAQAHGLRVKLHADQFHAIGGTELACEVGALSVDHLEASGAAQIAALAASETVATILPGVTLHLGLPAAPGRQLIDSGAIVAIGTDLNPGSSPLFSTQLALALAVRLCLLTPAEALSACTVNAAYALGLSDRGSLSAGQRADFLVLNGQDWREVAYTLGGNAVAEVYLAGAQL